MLSGIRLTQSVLSRSTPQKHVSFKALNPDQLQTATDFVVHGKGSFDRVKTLFGHLHTFEEVSRTIRAIPGPKSKEAAQASGHSDPEGWLDRKIRVTDGLNKRGTELLRAALGKPKK